MQLLERHARGISATVFGRALAERAKTIRTELRYAYDEINALRGAERGHVIVGALPSYAAGVLPIAVASLLAARPGIRVTVHEGLVDTLVRMVLAGDIDFAIMTIRHHDPSLPQEFLQERDLPLVVMGSKHPLSTCEEFDLDELSGLKWILPPKPDGMRLDFERLFESARLPSPRPLIESNSVLFIRTILREGHFAAYLPARLVRRDTEEKTLRCAEIRVNRRPSRVGFIYRRQSVLTPAARMLIDRTRAVCRA